MNLRDAISLGLLLLSILGAIPAAVLFVEIAAASLKPKDIDPSAGDDGHLIPSARLAVLMPAHDEAAGIEAVIAAVLPQLRAGDRLLVVADNCSDATATLARAAGAEVVERHDALRRGKGFALDHGVRWLERDPPIAVVILDADCIMAPHALERVVDRCLATGRPVQALYLMQAPQGAPLALRIAEFAWIVRNQLRPLGAAVLGWPCQLMGTGMAFPWPLLQRAPLATGHLVEDMQLGLDLAATGAAPLFCPEARVTSMFPTDAEGARTQRTRWEHGHLSVIAGNGPRMLWRAFARRDSQLAAMVLDLTVPPLASLVLLLALLVVVDAVWWLLSGGTMPFAVAAAALGLIGAAVIAAWHRAGRHIVSGRDLLRLPLYVIAKLPMYARLFTKRQVEWVRTRRDGQRR